MSTRARWITSRTGRSVLVALVLKAFILTAVWAMGTSTALEFIDRTVNLALLILAGVAIYRLTELMRARMLWSVRRKLVLSYILIGAVPLLLLLAFSLLGFLLVFFDISSYLVQNRLNGLTDEAKPRARTTLIGGRT